ncbi:hypothetical protein L1987_32608 [Smallanthus sonchifolius]|uniref:Uncharacterized protein n=1 Tax=Smallanthus sonchifolius TaxID=185202 RepID=A0ACB9HRA8_9ASTR|nr:hypothetical protein L1987_32608 [Smallanthus sonchifolius]
MLWALTHVANLGDMLTLLQIQVNPEIISRGSVIVLLDVNVMWILGICNRSGLVEVEDESNEPVSLKQSENIVSPKEQENGGLRRQSTRNRPPTARALEAFANGFLTVNSRKKGREESKSRNSKHTLGEVGVISECSTGDASSAVKGDDENGEIEK